MKLFATGKTGFLLDSIAHKTERRSGGETKVIVLGCKVSPFNHQLAQAMDDLVRNSLFMLGGNGEPRSHITGMDFKLPFDRQDINVFASPDTVEGTFRLEQVKVSGLRAQVEKDTNAYVLKVKLTFGPASERELAFVEGWLRTQKFLSFEESEPNLEFAEIGGGDDDDEDADDAQPALDMDTDDDEQSEEGPEPVAAGPEKPERTQRRPLSHARGRKGLRTKK